MKTAGVLEGEACEGHGSEVRRANRAVRLLSNIVSVYGGKLDARGTVEKNGHRTWAVDFFDGLKDVSDRMAMCQALLSSDFGVVAIEDRCNGSTVLFVNHPAFDAEKEG